MAHNCSNPLLPCPCPPHPDVIARNRQSILAQGILPQDEQAMSLSSGAPTGTIAGLNDHLIIPPSKDNVPQGIMAAPSASAPERTPYHGVMKSIVILVEFPNLKFKNGSGINSQMNDFFFSHKAGTVGEYFADVSNGKISAFQGQIAGPYMMPHDSKYYANGKHGMKYPGPNLQTLGADALAAAIKDGVSFEGYDPNGDGFVDGMVVVHAGTGAEQTQNPDDLWSVKWVLPDETSVGSKKVWAFCVIAEDTRLGVTCHELGHLLFGWPDLYDTDSTSAGIGNWCLMAGGCWAGGGHKPCHPSAWAKVEQKWVTVDNKTENGLAVCGDVKTSKSVCRLWTNGNMDSQEYFLVENRQRVGYDTLLPGDGLLIWRIDDSIAGNSNEDHPQVQLVEADGRSDLKFKAGYGDAGDPWPGTTRNFAFNANSTPNSKSYAGQDTISISSISNSAPTMTMDVVVKDSAPINDKTWYRLTNSLPGLALDVLNDGQGNKPGTLNMVEEGFWSGQFWRIKPRGDGTYTLCTNYLGPSRLLDVQDNNISIPHLGNAGPPDSGQFWTITPWGDGTYRLSSRYAGPDMCLDCEQKGTNVRMTRWSGAGKSTQHWKIIPIWKIVEPEFLH